MIYNNSIILTEADADEFLESVGVELFENHATINGEAYSGPDAEFILEENGIFLYEDCIVIEGQQAEEYKKRKAKEAEEESKKYNKYDNSNMVDSKAADAFKGRRARTNVGNQASIKQVDVKNLGHSIDHHQSTKMNDRIRANYAKEIVERDRLSKIGAYDGTGMTIRKGDDGKTKSWSYGQRGGKYNDGYHYGPDFGDKDSRIAYFAARDAANRHMRRHTKVVKEGSFGFFESLEFI